MKKLFIGLLVIAAGAGIFFFLQNKKSEDSNTFQKELVVGKWKLNSLDVKTKDSSAYYLSLISAIDSNFTKYRYDFKADGNVLKSLSDSVKADSSHYQWTKKNELTWKENATDSSASEIFTVTKLTTDSLLLLSKDSAIFVFTKWK